MNIRSFSFVMFLMLIATTLYGQLSFEDEVSKYDDPDIFIAQNDLEPPPPPDRNFTGEEFNAPPRKPYHGEDFEDHGRDKFTRGRNKQDHKISDKLENRILNTLKEHFPKFYARTIKLKSDHPVIYKNLLHKLRKHIRRSREPREEKIELISLIYRETEVEVMVKEYNRMSEGIEKDKLKSEIRKKVSDNIDTRLIIGKKLILKIEKDIERKKKAHQRQKDNKENLINKRMEKLLK